MDAHTFIGVFGPAMVRRKHVEPQFLYDKVWCNSVKAEGEPCRVTRSDTGELRQDHMDTA
eukprot:364830-Chlamydomonas_euryale.AAC.10